MVMQILFGFLVALGGALLADAIGTPIPWMLGSLIATATLKINGAIISSHAGFRKMGQWIIGAALGLQFTPEVLQSLQALLPYILLACVFAVLLGLLGSWMLYRWAKVDYATAFFSATVGGASEMVVLAEKNGATNLALVASAHSLRVLIIVILIPFAFEFLGFSGDASQWLSVPIYSEVGLLQLLGLTGVVCLVFSRLRVPNAMLLGALLGTALLTANDITLTHLRPEVQQLGQLFIGWSLGSNYKVGFFRQAPRFLAVVGVVTIVYLLLAFVLCIVIASFSGIALPTAILAMSPGGIAEMAITAKVLMLGASIVASFQVSRLIFVLLTVSPIYHAINSRLPHSAS